MGVGEMDDQLVEEKRANALKPDARARFEDKSELIFGFGDLLRSMFGGLWVGGTAQLYETKLVFRPNSLNRTAHADDATTEIELDLVTSVRVRGGLLTKIIDIAAGPDGLTIRCFGAEAFADRIREQAERHTGPPDIA
jgi:hypothetical protein